MNAKILLVARQAAWRWLLAALLGAAAACHSSRGLFTESGLGSYYADRFEGQRTASGEVYRPDRFTAAHNTLPFGTLIEVTNMRNGRAVNVTVNDRGPHGRGRIVDVSKRAAAQIGLLEAGVAPVRLRVVRAAR